MGSKVAFISHASEDAEVAGSVCAFLEGSGVSCWIAPRDVRPGRDYAAEIIDGIESSAVLVLLLSENANGSVFVKREVERAVSKGKPVFPIRVREVAPSKSLELYVSTAHWIDAWQPPIEQHLGQLAESIRSTAATYGAGAAATSVAAAPARATPGTGKWLAPAAAAVVAALAAYVALRPAGEAPPPPQAVQAPAAEAEVPARPQAPPRSPVAPVPPPQAQAAAVAAQPASDADAEPCPTRLSINRDLPTPFTCLCGAGAARGASVWGTDVYTDDSDLCRAAVHAGVIPAGGGKVTVLRAPGRALYAGTPRNGVRTSDYGAYSHSIRFQGAAAPPAGAERCPQHLSINRDLPTPFTCVCDENAIHGSSVWGTDTYTDDSDLCRAAVHAGAIPAGGGRITVLRAPGRAIYAGTSRNGVQSSDYGAFSHSIRFDKPR